MLSIFDPLYLLAYSITLYFLYFSSPIYFHIPSLHHELKFIHLLQINALANRATGKGYEDSRFYENIKFRWLPIENIHVMRHSYLRFSDCMYFIFIWVSLGGNYFDNGDFETFTISTRLMCSIVRGQGSKLEQQSGWEPVPRQHQLFARWSTPFWSAECLCRIRCTEFLQMGPAYSTNSRNCCFCSWCIFSLLTIRISFQ